MVCRTDMGCAVAEYPNVPTWHMSPDQDFFGSLLNRSGNPLNLDCIPHGGRSGTGRGAALEWVLHVSGGRPLGGSILGFGGRPCKGRAPLAVYQEAKRCLRFCSS